MEVPNSGTEQNQTSNIASEESTWGKNSRKRHNLEIKRRFHELQVRRDHLERELQSVNNCLVSLDRQIQSHAAYKQLLISH